MSYAQAQRAAQRKIVIVQVLLVAIITAIFFYAADWRSAVSVLYGSFIVILSYRLQAWQLRRADLIAGYSPERNLQYLYRCAIERFVAAVALMALGIGLMKLGPFPLLSGFAITQAGMVYRWFQESSVRRRHG